MPTSSSRSQQCRRTSSDAQAVNLGAPSRTILPTLLAVRSHVTLTWPEGSAEMAGY